MVVVFVRFSLHHILEIFFWDSRIHVVIVIQPSELFLLKKPCTMYSVPLTSITIQIIQSIIQLA
jgi:hypothetical protein